MTTEIFTPGTILCVTADQRYVPVTPMRYIIINTDKHQGDVRLTNAPHEADYENAREYLSLIIDVQEKQRYYGEGWAPCTMTP